MILKCTKGKFILVFFFTFSLYLFYLNSFLFILSHIPLESFSFLLLLPLKVATADHWSTYSIWHRIYAGCPFWCNHSIYIWAWDQHCEFNQPVQRRGWVGSLPGIQTRPWWLEYRLGQQGTTYHYKLYTIDIIGRILYSFLTFLTTIGTNHLNKKAYILNQNNTCTIHSISLKKIWTL